MGNLEARVCGVQVSDCAETKGNMKHNECRILMWAI